jgi:outer membrane murein-binding lipoprotein Lpp
MERITAAVFLAAFGLLLLGGCSNSPTVDPLATGSLSHTNAESSGGSGGAGGGASGGY